MMFHRGAVTTAASARIGAGKEGWGDAVCSQIRMLIQLKTSSKKKFVNSQTNLLNPADCVMHLEVMLV